MDKTVLETINVIYDKLFPAEKKVADFILKNYRDVVYMNVSELAAKANASDATVIRTAKRLGCTGYSQLQIELCKDIEKSELLTDKDDELSSVQKFFLIEAERINRLASTIDLYQLINIAKVIISSSCTHIIAVGNTTPISSDLGFRLERRGIKCTYSPIYEQFLNHINLGDSNECVIAITRSGRSKQVIQAIKMAKKKEMKIIVITGEVNNELFQYVDYVIKLNELKTKVSSIYHPDSHLLEYAINDSLLYVINNVQIANNPSIELTDEIDEIGIMISEFKI